MAASGKFYLKMKDGSLKAICYGGGGTVGGTDTDEKAKVSANDTTAGYLNGKLTAGTGITLTEGSDGGNETLAIAATAVTFTTDFAIKMSADQTIANLTTTKITNFDTIIIDSNSEWDAVNLRWVCATTGTYVVNARLTWAPNATGYRLIYIYLDGALVAAFQPGASSASFNTHSTIVYKLSVTAGQYIEIYGRQNSGGNLDALASTPPVEWQVWRVK